MRTRPSRTLLAISWRGLVERWARVTVAALAITASIAFVTGALLVTDAAHRAYQDAAATISNGTDVYVRGPETDVRQGIGDFAPVPASLVASVGRVPGVRASEGVVSRTGQLVDATGRFLTDPTTTYVSSWPHTDALQGFDVVAGRPPAAPAEVVIDTATARASGLALGDTVRVAMGPSTPLPAVLVGLVEPREGGDLAGAASAFVDLAWAQQVLGLGDRVDLVELRAKDVDPDVLRAAVQHVLPDDGSSAVTSRQYAAAQIANLSRRAGSVTTILVALSLLALVVGIGVVITTLTALVVQRTRELALLRTVGLSRREAAVSVLVEAALLGLVAGTVGALVGWPTAIGLKALVHASGRNLPGSIVAVRPLLLVIPALLGAAATVIAGILPARRASSVAPVAAWREVRLGPPPTRTRPWARVATACALAGVVLAGMALALEPGVPAGTFAGAGALLAAAAGLTLPALAPRLLAAAGRVLSRLGPAGAVARQSLGHQPQRAVMPAASLVLGIGFVTAVAVLSSSVHASIRDLVRRADRADLVIVSDSAPGIDPEAVERVREAPTVAGLVELGHDRFTVEGGSAELSAIDIASEPDALNLPVRQGTLGGFADGTIAVTESAARSHGVHVGDYVRVQLGLPQRRSLRIVAVIADNGVTRDWVIPFETYRRGYYAPTIRAVFVKTVPGTPLALLERQARVGVAGFPGVEVIEPATYAARQARQAEGPVKLVQTLATLAVVMALVGVANAQGLAVLERQDELRLLRLVGMTTAQVSLSVRWEAVAVAALGTAVGLASGLLLSVTLALGGRSSGLEHVVVPAPMLGLVVVLVLAGAFLAATVPARRAARWSDDAVFADA
jgi:putative ABC transport system permease protein